MVQGPPSDGRPIASLTFASDHTAPTPPPPTLATNHTSEALPPGLGWSLLGVAASAAIGNTVASVFRVPYEVVKQRLQAGMYASTGQALRTMYQEGGMAAFFGRGGVASQILRDVPYAIVTLLTYESLRRARAEMRKGAPSSPFEDSMIGALAGGFGSLISNPMDVVK